MIPAQLRNAASLAVPPQRDTPIRGACPVPTLHDLWSLPDGGGHRSWFPSPSLPVRITTETIALIIPSALPLPSPPLPASCEGSSSARPGRPGSGGPGTKTGLKKNLDAKPFPLGERETPILCCSCTLLLSPQEGALKPPLPLLPSQLWPWP